MARAVLHIGTHKTATTTLQDTFAANRDLLAQHGLIYPALGTATGHHGLAAGWNRSLAPYALPGGSRAALERLASDLGAGPGTVLLSSEEFSRGREGGRVNFRALRAALAGFDRIEVVCLLRPQWEFVQSIYLEVSKTRAPGLPARMLEGVLAHHMASGLWTDYSLLYDHLRQAFDPREITLLDFGRCAAAPGGVLGAMLAHLGVALDPGALVPVNGGRSNVSAPPLAVLAANRISPDAVAPPFLTRAAAGALAVEYGEGRAGCLWSRGQLKRLAAYARAANARLGARLVADGMAAPEAGALTGALSGALSAPGTGGDGMVHPEDLDDGFWRRCNRWLFAGLVPPGPAAARQPAGASPPSPAPPPAPAGSDSGSDSGSATGAAS